jgi:hypothetical protein
MKTILILAGLHQTVFERVRSVPAGRFIPNGHLVRSPLHDRAYTDQYSVKLIEMAHAVLVAEREDEEIGIILLYVNRDDTSTRRFVESFFPFALPVAVSEFVPSSNIGANAFNRELNAYVAYLEERSRRAIDLIGVVRKYTNVHNLTPLLLPTRNFQSASLITLLQELFWNLSTAASPDELIRRETRRFSADHPRVYPPDSDQSCYSDAILYFKSPGRNRHGFFRHSQSARHPFDCLLNARSRLGGTYDYKFHYDCEALRGGLAATYPNCHAQLCKPGSATYVNIAPNDFIR